MAIAEPFRMIWDTLKAWWEAWTGLWLIGLVWVLCWMTLVLGPPATFGFFYSARWLIAEGDINWKHFYRMAIKHFLVSWLWFLACLLVLFLVYSNYVFYDSLANGVGSFLRVLALVVGFLWTVVQFYALPYYVLLEKKSLWIAWKNGLYTILASPIFSLVLWIVLAALLFLHAMIFPIFLAGPGLVVLLASMAVENRIQKFGIRERDANEAANSAHHES
jgi:uncharacterized membrane protein YesL